jgi:hypothetical protein
VPCLWSSHVLSTFISLSAANWPHALIPLSDLPPLAMLLVDAMYCKPYFRCSAGCHFKAMPVKTIECPPCNGTERKSGFVAFPHQHQGHNNE